MGLEGEGDFEGDRRAVDEIARVLKPGGRLIMTVPFGRRLVHYRDGAAGHRVYDQEQLATLLSGFELETEECAVATGNAWLPSSVETAGAVDHADIKEWHSARAVAMVVAGKRDDEQSPSERREE